MIDDKKGVEESPVDWLRSEILELANNLESDIKKAKEHAEIYNTIEPIIQLFEGALALIASLYSGYRMLNEDQARELLNCRGCVKRDICETYLEYLEKMEGTKQGKLFEIDVDISKNWQ